MGEGKYISRLNGNKTNCYNAWHDMLRRCYSEETHKKMKTYIGCSVCDEWHNYQNFAKWYDLNFYLIDKQTMCLDKDIIHKGNKIYSPENCVFAPNNINCMFTKTDAKRGEYPIGVRLSSKNRYSSVCCDGSKKGICVGYYGTPELAFNAYKLFKEHVIRSVADKYKNEIPFKLYDAMYNYIVEITD